MVGFTALALAYDVISPPFENPDEINHAEYVTFIADRGRLPALSRDCVRLAFHPPLYPALLVPLARLTATATEDVLTDHRMNPEFPASPMVLLHGQPDEAFPYAGRARFVHLARLLTAIIGSLVVLYTYRLARVLDFDTVSVAVATATAAAVPQFQYIAASLNHDALAAASAAALLYYAVLLGVRPTLGVSIKAGVALGAGLLAKTSLLVLAPVPLSLAAMSSRPSARTRAGLMIVTYGVAAAMSGWWYVGMAREWGTIAPIVRIHQHTWVGYDLVRTAPLRLDELPALGWQLFASFWFLAGLLNVPAPGLLYVFWGVVSAAAVVGLAVMLRVPRERVLAITAGVCLAAVLGYNRYIYSAQGRYLFVVLPIIGLAVARGVGVIVPRRARPMIARGLIGSLVAASLIALSWSFAPAYRHVAPRDSSARVATAQLYCGNEYEQTVTSRGGVLTAVRLRGRRLGAGSFAVSMHLLLADGTGRESVVDGAAMPTVDGVVTMTFPPIALAAGQRYALTLRAPDAHPFARPAFEYVRRMPGALSVNGLAVGGDLDVEEVFTEPR